MPNNHERFDHASSHPTPPQETEPVRKLSILSLDLARQRSIKVKEETTHRPGLQESVSFWKRQVTHLRETANDEEFDEILGTFLADLEDQSSVDALTRLYTRGAIIKKTSELISHTERTGEDLSIAVLDLDKFKDTNDRYGHIVGDAVLRSTAHHIMTSSRGADMASRWGGEEIMEVLPATSLADAIEALERQRMTLPDQVRSLLAIENTTMQKNTTFSVGVVTFNPHEYQELFGSIQEQRDKILTEEGIDLSQGDEKTSQLWKEVSEAMRVRQIFDYHYALADHALYAAKTLGRNRTVALLPDPDGDHLFVDMRTGITYVENERTKRGKTNRGYEKISL